MTNHLRTDKPQPNVKESPVHHLVPLAYVHQFFSAVCTSRESWGRFAIQCEFAREGKIIVKNYRYNPI